MKKSLEEIKQDLKSIISDMYAPESSRLRRNYTDKADWYFISKNEGWK